MVIWIDLIHKGSKITFLDVRLRCLEEVPKHILPKWWWMMVVNPTVQIKENHQTKESNPSKTKKSNPDLPVP